MRGARGVPCRTQELFDVVQEARRVQRLSWSSFLVAPQLMLGSSLHVHAVSPASSGLSMHGCVRLT